LGPLERLGFGRKFNGVFKKGWLIWTFQIRLVKLLGETQELGRFLLKGRGGKKGLEFP